MKCPVCNAWTLVKDSRENDLGHVRRRECANGHRFKTVEALLPGRKPVPKAGN